jgi:hypothetical protein
MTLRLEFGILSWPATPLASLPPELDVPLPLREELPVVAPEFGAVEGFAELAAGSPVTEPRPLGPPCACARLPERAITTDTTTTADFMMESFRLIWRTTNRDADVPVVPRETVVKPFSQLQDISRKRIAVMISAGFGNGGRK